MLSLNMTHEYFSFVLTDSDRQGLTTIKEKMDKGSGKREKLEENKAAWPGERVECCGICSPEPIISSYKRGLILTDLRLPKR